MGSGRRTDPPGERGPRADGSGHGVPEGQASEEYGDH
ncbi:cytochrome c oxidase subunit III, partial [Natrinema versiforme JCM 10478]